MTNDPTDWHQALASVSGRLVRGEQRVTTHELLTVHLGVPVTDRACRRLRRVMLELGWHGPRLMRWGKQTLKGYWRHPTAGLPAIVQEKPVAEVATAERETLAPELERVTLLRTAKAGADTADPHRPGRRQPAESANRSGRACRQCADACGRGQAEASAAHGYHGANN